MSNTTYQNADLVRFHWEEADETVTASIVRVYKTKARVRVIDGANLEGEVLSVGLDELSPVSGGKARMAETLAKYREKYEPSVSASGRKSLNNGDDLASLLEYKDHREVCAIAEVALDLPGGELVRAYAHLNNGQQRMCAGNRLRAALKRGDLTIDDMRKAAKAVTAEA